MFDSGWFLVLSGFVFGVLVGLPLYPRLCMWKNREALACLAHEQWSGWMQYFFKKCDYNSITDTWTVPTAYVVNLQKLIGTPYGRLSEEQKNNDRVEADKMLKIIFGDE